MGETNKKFVTRFQQVVVKIEDPMESVIVTAFKRGISLVERMFTNTSPMKALTLSPICSHDVENTWKERRNSKLGTKMAADA